MFWIAVTIFSVSLILFIFDWVDKTIVSLLGAMLLLVFGVFDFKEAIMAIDMETLALLFGLMLTVAIAQHSGIFSWLNANIARISKGSPIAIFILFTALTFFTSTILNNATVILLVIPIAIALANGLGLNSKLLVIILAMFSNIGGTLTLIGDPPNTLIGVQAGLSFNSFIYNLWIPVFGISIALAIYFVVFYRSSFKSISKNLPKLFISNLIIERINYIFENQKISKPVVLTTTLFILLTVLAFIFQPFLGMALGTIGLLSGVGLALCVFKKIPFLTLIKEVEWDSLLFFAGLFVQVGALEKVGALEMITHFIAGFSDSYAMLLMVIVWGIGLASMIINNIPFVALMIPVIFDLQDKLAGIPYDLNLLWWALALGACLGGNGTIIGSSSGILAIDIAKKSGIKISFSEFAKVGVPVTIISLAVSSLYLLGRLYI